MKCILFYKPQVFAIRSNGNIFLSFAIAIMYHLSLFFKTKCHLQWEDETEISDVIIVRRAITYYIKIKNVLEGKENRIIIISGRIQSADT